MKASSYRQQQDEQRRAQPVRIVPVEAAGMLFARTPAFAAPAHPVPRQQRVQSALAAIRRPAPILGVWG